MKGEHVVCPLNGEPCHWRKCVRDTLCAYQPIVYPEPCYNSVDFVVGNKCDSDIKGPKK